MKIFDDPIFAFGDANDEYFKLLKEPNVIGDHFSLGIIFGLFIVKQIGIFGFSYILVKLKIAKLPSQVTKKHLYGASVMLSALFFVAKISKIQVIERKENQNVFCVTLQNMRK